MDLDRWRLTWRSRVMSAVWWVWPSVPTSWAQVPARLRPALVQVTRLTVAAVVAYVIANLVSPGILDLTAPLTALLVVQASTVGTLQMGLVRVGAVLTGVLVATGIASFIGLSWWSLAIVIAVSLLLAKLFRLRDQSLEAPISAMLILAVSTPELAAEVRIVNTLIGTGVGVAFSLLIPIAIPNARAGDAVRRVARSETGLLDEMAVGIASGPPGPEEVAAWLSWSDDIDREIAVAAAAVDAVEQSRKLNARALASATVHPGLLNALSRLTSCLAAVRALLVVLRLQPPARPADDGAQVSADVRRAFAVLLGQVARGLQSFADIIDAEFGTSDPGRAEEALAQTAETVREARAVLTELMLVDVDVRERSDLWMLQGSVLAAVEHILRELDFELGHRAEPWLTRRAVPLLPDPWRSLRRERSR